jgi:hypothetical protein
MALNSQRKKPMLADLKVGEIAEVIDCPQARDMEGLFIQRIGGTKDIVVLGESRWLIRNNVTYDYTIEIRVCHVGELLEIH